MSDIAIISFYSFVRIEDRETLLPKILWIAKRKMVKGTVLLAEEGFNGTLAGSEKNVRIVIEEIIKLTSSSETNIKVNYADTLPFRKLKVKLKREIVTLGAGKIDVEKMKGEYIEPQKWDDFISRDDVVLIDTRNDYEVDIGAFQGAIDPKTNNFREFPEWAAKNEQILKNKKIAMYCTGGIRCEKSTAYLKSLGYDQVYHLKGGILQYLENTKNDSGKWEGKCFVFDDRRAVKEDLAPADGYWIAR